MHVCPYVSTVSVSISLRSAQFLFHLAHFTPFLLLFLLFFLNFFSKEFSISSHASKEVVMVVVVA